MRFEHPTQQETFERLREYLEDLFEKPYLDEESDHFYVRYGTTVLELSVDPCGAEETMVIIMAYCVQDVEVEEELLVGLLELNHSLVCGSFSLVGTDIFFSHSLFGRSLDPRDLLRAITAVATVSDDYDDRIVARYGGQTALERIQDTGGRRRRQGTLEEGALEESASEESAQEE
jgi:hypothetical protein